MGVPPVPHPTAAVAWWQLQVLLPARQADDAAAALIEAGAQGVQIEDLGGRPASLDGEAPPAMVAVGRPPGGARLTAAWALGSVAADTPQAARERLAHAARAAMAEVGVAVAAAQIVVARREDGDWSTRWRAHFKPLKIGRRLWVVPSWEEAFRAPTGSVALRLDPGMAFGTGEHATTAMCLRAVERFADARPAPGRARASMLDVGCGTGILAIAALRLGLGAAAAVDIDPMAVRAARDNARANGVDLQPTATPIEDIDATFDLVAANILAGPLVAMAAALLGRVRPGGTLVLGGLLRAQADEVLGAYLAAAARAGGGRVSAQYHWTHGEWAALQLGRA